MFMLGNCRAYGNDFAQKPVLNDLNKLHDQYKYKPKAGKNRRNGVHSHRMRKIRI